MKNANSAPLSAEALQDHFVLASFPKSGNTWLRFLVANVYNTLDRRFEEVDFHNIHDICPELQYPNVPIPFYGQFPYVFKTHENYREIFKNVILIVRNPWDVMNSYRHYLIEEMGLSISLAEIVEHDRYGIQPIVEHTDSYLKSCDNLLLLTYEKFLLDPMKEVKKLCDFIGINASLDVIEKAVDKSSFKSMRAIEVKKGRKFGRPEYRFTRSGTSGEGIRQITDDRLNELIVREMKKSPVLYMLYC